ncbi:MAG: GNAT family N-acetyltransferase [Thermoplasmata archaeon]|nr:GNAT family N-acetyltransferase [Thermoplasmata archaeon]
MLTIRGFRPTDLPQVKRLSDRTLGEPYDPNIFSIIHRTQPEGFIVACYGDEIVGFALAVREEGWLRILMLSVSERWRRKGIGSALLEEITSRFRGKGLKGITLEVRVSNHEAISFYHKRGFATVELLHGYYTDGGPAYRMVKMGPW